MSWTERINLFDLLKESRWHLL